MTSANVQNTVRLRVFLIVVISIILRIAREFSSVPVHKATNILLANYIFYGIILLCTVAMSKVAFGVAMFLQLVATAIDAASTTLAIIATMRCINAQQAVCIHTLPGSVVTVALAALLWLLDALQCWSIYKVLRMPSFTSYLGRRLRVLFSWALPFAFLNTGVLLAEASWSVFTTPHLVVDPLIIVMAPTLDAGVIAVIIAAVVATDCVALYLTANSLVRLSIAAQLAISAFALILVLASKVNMPNNENTSDKDETPVLAAEAVTKTTLRQRKSKQKIAF